MLGKGNSHTARYCILSNHDHHFYIQVGYECEVKTDFTAILWIAITVIGMIGPEKVATTVHDSGSSLLSTDVFSKKYYSFLTEEPHPKLFDDEKMVEEEWQEQLEKKMIRIPGSVSDKGEDDNNIIQLYFNGENDQLYIVYFDALPQYPILNFSDSLEIVRGLLPVDLLSKHYTHSISNYFFSDEVLTDEETLNAHYTYNIKYEKTSEDESLPDCVYISIETDVDNTLNKFSIGPFDKFSELSFSYYDWNFDFLKDDPQSAETVPVGGMQYLFNFTPDKEANNIIKSYNSRTQSDEIAAENVTWEETAGGIHTYIEKGEIKYNICYADSYLQTYASNEGVSEESFKNDMASFLGAVIGASSSKYQELINESVLTGKYVKHGSYSIKCTGQSFSCSDDSWS